MSTLYFTVTEDKADQLTCAAPEQSVTVEQLLQTISDEFLARKAEFQPAAECVLRKNAELYRRPSLS